MDDEGLCHVAEHNAKFAFAPTNSRERTVVHFTLCLFL
jgi:hypothetical protein